MINFNNPTRFWIIGAGRFGRIAVSRILRNIPGAEIRLVDKQPVIIDDTRVRTIQADGIDWLETMINHEDMPVDMIVPAIPIHVAAEWLKRKLSCMYKIFPTAIPDDCLASLPNAVKGDADRIYISHADFICPDTCPEPETICTVTGKHRPLDLFRLLENFSCENYLPLVVRSHQLFPGVGGIHPESLSKLLDAALQNSHRPLMIGTACRCNGVMDFLQLA
ncbi:MAG: hypothetical protein KFF50_06270 [Desulfatitalea sp.]|nr:hypothetical protein [Desulfatitalea sp.]